MSTGIPDNTLRIFTEVFYCRFGLLIIKSRPFVRLGNELNIARPFSGNLVCVLVVGTVQHPARLLCLNLRSPIVSAVNMPVWMHQRPSQHVTSARPPNHFRRSLVEGGRRRATSQRLRGGRRAAGGEGAACADISYVMYLPSRCRASQPTSGLPIYVLAKRPPTVNSATLTSANADPPITADPRLASLFWYKRWTFAHARHETTPPPPLRATAPPSLQHFVWLLLCLSYLALRFAALRGRCSLRSPCPLRLPRPPPRRSATETVGVTKHATARSSTSATSPTPAIPAPNA